MNGFTNFVNHSNKPTQEGEKMWEGTTEKGWKRNGGGGREGTRSVGLQERIKGDNGTIAVSPLHLRQVPFPRGQGP